MQNVILNYNTIDLNQKVTTETCDTWSWYRTYGTKLFAHFVYKIR